MSRLTKGLFDQDVARGVQPLFGLRSSRMACSEIVHNGGWYNLAGEKLGWGDLSAVDIIRLMAELQGDEAFLVIGEHATHWAFTRHDRARFGTAGMDPSAPGLVYVLKHLRWVILLGVAYQVSDNHKGGPTVDQKGWLKLRNYVTVTRDWMIDELCLCGLLPPVPGIPGEPIFVVTDADLANQDGPLSETLQTPVSGPGPACQHGFSDGVNCMVCDTGGVRS